MHSKKAAFRIEYNRIEELREDRWLKEFEEVKKINLKAPFYSEKRKKY